MTDKTCDLLVVGAGVSGLSMAHYGAGCGWRVAVLEAEQRSGGSLHSQRFQGTDFWLELGAHSCFNSYGKLIGILEKCGLLEQIRGKAKVPFKLLTDGRLQAVLAPLHWLELARSLPRLLTAQKTGKTVAEYYRRVLGRRNYENLFGPAFDAVICQPAGEFPADILFGKRARRKDVMRSFTFPTGLQTIADVLTQQAGIEVLTGRQAQTVAFEATGWTVTTTAGEHYRGRLLCLATPVCAAAALLATAAPTLAALLQHIQTVTVDTAGVMVRREALPSLPSCAGIIARGDSFYSVVARDTVPHDSYRGFTFHFRPDALDEAGRLRRMAEVLGLRTDDFAQVTGKRNRLPALRVGHTDLVGKIDRELSGAPLALTGNYFTGVSLEDCVARSLKECRRLQDRMDWA